MTARSPHIISENIPSGYTNKGEAMLHSKPFHLPKSHTCWNVTINTACAYLNSSQTKGVLRADLLSLAYHPLEHYIQLHILSVFLKWCCLKSPVRLPQSSSLKPAESAHFYIYKVLKTGSMTFFFSTTASKTVYNTDFCIAVTYSTNVFSLSNSAFENTITYLSRLSSWVYHVKIKQGLKPAINKAIPLTQSSSNC